MYSHVEHVVDMFKEFLDWAANNGVLPLLAYLVADKDSSLRSIVKSDLQCKHIVMLGDGGHWKSRIYRTLDKPKYFGSNGGTAKYKGMADKFARWTLRCLMEAKSKYASMSMSDTTQTLIYLEFCRRFEHILPHYTSTCNALCPCQDARNFIVELKDYQALPLLLQGLPFETAVVIASNLKYVCSFSFLLF